MTTAEALRRARLCLGLRQMLSSGHNCKFPGQAQFEANCKEWWWYFSLTRKYWRLADCP